MYIGRASERFFHCGFEAGSFYVALAVLQTGHASPLRDPPASASGVLGLKT